MKDDHARARESTDMKGPGRKAWVKPTLAHLNAGGAENVPGSSIADTPLETIGS